MTVTGVTVPSAANNCVIPTFLPMIPLIIVDFQVPIADRCVHLSQRPIGNWQWEFGNALALSKRLNLHVHSRRQIELHQSINRLRRRIEDVHQTLMRSDFKLLARLLVDVRRTQHGPLILDRRQRNWSSHARAGSLCRLDDFRRRLIQHPVIVSLEPDPDFFVKHSPMSPIGLIGLIAHGTNETDATYSTTSDTVPAPTVRPPSRIAKRKPFSMAIGAINSISICTLSPGITISTPCGRCATPVTSVVRK